MVAKLPAIKRGKRDGQRASGANRKGTQAPKRDPRASKKSDGGSRVAARPPLKREDPEPEHARQRFAAVTLATVECESIDAIRRSGRTILIFAATYGQALSVAKKQKLGDSWLHVRRVEDVMGFDPATVATITLLGYMHDEKIRDAKKTLDQIARAHGVTIPSFDPC